MYISGLIQNCNGFIRKKVGIFSRLKSQPNLLSQLGLCNTVEIQKNGYSRDFATHVERRGNGRTIRSRKRKKILWAVLQIIPFIHFCPLG